MMLAKGVPTFVIEGCEGESVARWGRLRYLLSGDGVVDEAAQLLERRDLFVQGRDVLTHGVGDGCPAGGEEAVEGVVDDAQGGVDSADELGGRGVGAAAVHYVKSGV